MKIEKIQKICQEAYKKYTKGLLADYYYGRIYSTCMHLGSIYLIVSSSFL